VSGEVVTILLSGYVRPSGHHVRGPVGGAGGAVGSHEDQNAEIIRTLFASVSANNYDDMARLFAEDIEFETPFAPDDYAMHVVGRGPLKEALARISSTFAQVVFKVDRTYAGADGETIVVEYHSHATVKRTGKPYANRYVGIFRIRDGTIALWCEYYNPEVLTSAMA
jgi:ketosteroid isomerase-like protein